MRTFLCSLFLVSSLLVSADHIEVSGPVSGIWSADTVLVTGDIALADSETLEVEPGTLVIFSGHYRFIVFGSILAAGTSDHPIRFTAADTTGFSDTLTEAGGWHGFVYEHLAPGTDSSRFEFCQFEFGKAFSADTFGQYGGAFRIFNFDKVMFTNCLFFNNFSQMWGGALYLRNSDIIIRNCTFENNRCGLEAFPWGYGGGLCSVLSEPVVTGCLFEQNTATGYGGGAAFEYSDPDLRYNVFRMNFGGLAGGVGFLRSAPSRVVSNNLVYGNTARFFGGGIACNGASPVFANNTITDNEATYGGGFYANDSAVPVLYNTILRGNTGFGHEVYIWDIRSAPSFYYCNIAGDSADFEGTGSHEGFQGTYEDNLDEDALFRMTGEHLWALTTGSPCIDSGTPDTTALQTGLVDLEGSTRIWNGRIDIGAYEWKPGLGLPGERDPGIRISASPNPFSDKTTLTITGVQGNRISGYVTDLSGRLVRPLSVQGSMSGGVSISFSRQNPDGTLLPCGIYVVSCQDGVSPPVSITILCKP